MSAWGEGLRSLRAAAGLAIILAGCAHYPPLTHTPKYRIPVHVRADVPVDEVTVLMWVDLRGDEWIRNKDAWGCSGFHGFELEMLMRAEPVIIFPGYSLPDRADGALGYNEYEGDAPQIHISINSPPLIVNSDLYNGVGIGIVAFDYSYGLRQLPHEWTHTARGNWHP